MQTRSAGEHGGDSPGGEISCSMTFNIDSHQHLHPTMLKLDYRVDIKLRLNVVNIDRLFNSYTYAVIHPYTPFTLKYCNSAL